MSQLTVLEKLPTIHGLVSAGIDAYQRQRIYILPTRYGLFFAGLLLVMLTGAINYTNSMAYILTFLLGSLMLVGMLHTWQNLRGLLISTPVVRPVFAGAALHLPLLLDNRAGLQRIALTLELWSRRKEQRRGSAGEPLTINLKPGAITQAQLLVKTSKRGYLRPGRLRIRSRFPLGLFLAWSYLESDQVCIIYPQPAGSRELPVYSEYATDEQQGKKSGTDDFTGFKPYRHGDSIRSIDWKAFARQQPLQVKRFSGSGSSKLMLSWNLCGPGADVEQRLSQLCLWALHAERDGYHYGLEIPGGRIESGRGEAHLQQCLTLLAGYGYADESL
ncbi:MAG: hypothetical protein HW386_715 [Gammaproteobacteria bacterium]|nr:hypothetical protein [Gammaproteobacteria bacterium]